MDPSFVFEDAGWGTPAAALASRPAWSFEGAASAVEKEHARVGTTSVDAKIRDARRRSAAPKRDGTRAPPAAPAASDDDSDDDSEGLLPGEEPVCSDDDDDDGDDSDGEEEDEDEEEDDDEAEEETPAAAAAAAANDDDDDSEEEEESDGSEESDGGSEEAEERVAVARRPPAKGAAAAPGRAAAAARRPAAEPEDPNTSDEEDDPEPDGWAGPSASGAAGPQFSASSFAQLHLSRPLLKACEALGYTRPTPIQAAVVPLALTGRDVLGRAVTGSGKTAAFMLPLLERLVHRQRRVPATRVLVLTPTRELAVQVHQMSERLAQYTDVRLALVVGGLSLNVQASALRSRPEVVVATPGRMIDHLRNTQSVGLEELAAIVLDEADRLLELGFAEEVREIVKMCPKQRQTLLFSATLSKDVEDLAALSLKTPAKLSADGFGDKPGTLVEEVVKIKPQHIGDKEAILLALCSRSFTKRTIVFFKMKTTAHRTKIVFGLAGLSAAELHGNMSQAQRLAALEEFRQGRADFLLATDVAARGLDITGVEAVVSYDAAPSLASYLHRVGRTARAGAKGRALMLVEENDRRLLKEIVKSGGGRQMKARTVPGEAVAMWRKRLEGYKGAIEDIELQEREERYLRKAEMEAQKAENLMEHAAEIHARPARTWFQSERQKREAAEASKAAFEEGGDGQPAKKAKKDERNRDRKGKEKDSEADARRKVPAEQAEGRLQLAGKAKAFKRAERVRREGGQGPTRASKGVRDDFGGGKDAKRKRAGGARKDASDKLFSGDGIGSSLAGSRGVGSVSRAGPGALKGSRKGLGLGGGRVEKHVDGSKRGKFKSKAKYKRRK